MSNNRVGYAKKILKVKKNQFKCQNFCHKSFGIRVDLKI